MAVSISNTLATMSKLDTTKPIARLWGNTVTSFCALAFAFVALLGWSAVVRGAQSSDTDRELDRFAQKVLSFLEQEEQTSIVVGKIQPVGNRPIPGGPGLSTRLIGSLNRLRPGAVSDNALWTIEGKLLAGDDPKDLGAPEAERNLIFTIKFSVINQQTQQEWNETIIVNKLSEVQVVVGSNSQSDPSADARETRAEVRRSIGAAPVIDAASPSKVRPTSDSPFALELRFKEIGAESQNGSPVNAVLEKHPGLLPGTEQQFAFASISKNQEYEIVIHNESESEIAAAVFVDGIDVFTFSEDRDPKTKLPLFSHFIVAAKSETVIPGWHQTVGDKRDDNFLAFLVTEYGKGARSRLAPQHSPEESVGAVTVAISQSFQLGDNRAKSAAETGFGRPIKQTQKPQTRTINPPHAFITIRYDR